MLTQLCYLFSRLLLMLTSHASCQVLSDMEMIRKAIIMAAENDTSYNYDQQDVYR